MYTHLKPGIAAVGATEKTTCRSTFWQTLQPITACRSIHGAQSSALQPSTRPQRRMQSQQPQLSAPSRPIRPCIQSLHPVSWRAPLASKFDDVMLEKEISSFLGEGVLLLDTENHFLRPRQLSRTIKAWRYPQTRCGCVVLFCVSIV